MILISHRRNTMKQLLDTPVDMGVEIDIRSEAGKLILHHDPFAAGEFFEDWLTSYRHRMLILNVKEEGLEDAILMLMRQYGIEDFFFLDQSFPFIIRTTRRGEHRCAVRVSEFESVDTALALANQAAWVWLDCFTRFPIDGAVADRLKKAGFRLCLVSPELQGRTDPSEVASMRAELLSHGITADAVCTKFPERWR